ncbi:PHP domain-containing protein [Roseibium album]|uniref:Phosphate ABC transporter, ATP-binding protein n=1 Tax=Roseibium album TaxID=311410 RepID=A0A0M6ZZ25_9HYPH|nr:phosphotransferase [Roseibium album]CTQ61170.1 phosphate ABC transporter, ATP-binding protein [Roseibium album]CTQ67551.1 phosphate ABC transporter, ATP-binding protein [Roseibium album]CTQ78851.1 phosphate ABC transporter, ATP-binding protein [Roseibium album]
MIKIDFHIHTKTSILDAAFDFSQTKLDEYIENAGLDCIAITNHNLFDKEQFAAIRDAVTVPVFPGIEVDLCGAQILVFTDGQDLDSFEEQCRQVSAKCDEVGASITVEDFKSIFGDLSNYILIPHYDKKPAIKENTLAQLAPHVTAGEVSSVKKFIYSMNSAERLVPVYFSDCRVRDDLDPLPTRQTYLDCSEPTFSAIKECLRDKTKVALSKADGNRLFQVFENGQQLSTGLNVILGDRSSGKSHTLEALKKRFPEAHHIRQFALVARDADEDEKKFNSYLTRKQGLFSKDYLTDLQQVIEDVLDIDLDGDTRQVEAYLSSLLEFARERERHDAFSKARIYREDLFPDRNLKGLRDLIASTKNLISNVEFKETIAKHLARESLVSLYVDLMQQYARQEELRLKKVWVNDLVQNIKAKLQLRSAAPRISDVDLYEVALNKRKVAKFEEISKLAQMPKTPLRKSMRGFSVVAEVGPFRGTQEMWNVLRRRPASFANAFKAYGEPYRFLQELKAIGGDVKPPDFCKYFVKIDYRILNKDGFDASGGERSEFFLLDEIEGAAEHEMLLIDEPESSFDNSFLKDDVNSLIKEMAKKMPVVVVTHNNTVGMTIKPDYLLFTEKAIEDGEVVWRTYSGYPTSKKLTSPDGTDVATFDIVLGSLEAGSKAYDERRHSYENLKD